MNTEQPPKKNARAIITYGVISMLLILLSVKIMFTAGKLMFGDEGRAWSAKYKEITSIRKSILPSRGNIFSSDGKFLAISEPRYGIYMDFQAGSMNKDTLYTYVDDLSKGLSEMFRDRSSSEYKRIITEGYKNKSRYTKIVSRDISYFEVKEIRKLPLFLKGNNHSGKIEVIRNTRQKPFGNLANRTIGTVYKEIERGGSSGLELKYDSLLRGEQGDAIRRRIHGKWRDYVIKPAVDGIDIVTTIDTDIQDITESELRTKLESIGAESGCAVIMEVSTGEIKGIANLNRGPNGQYTEMTPNVFSYMSEPGSTFKAITMMIGLEDGVVNPDDPFFVGTGVYNYKGKNINDWYKGRDKGTLTAVEGMEISSNIVMSKIVLKGYEDNPAKFVEKIEKIGLTKKMEWDVPLGGKEGTCVIPHPNNKGWSKLTLPWMSFGYATEFPPIYMLMFYNALANEGKMLKPFITKAFKRDGNVIEEFKAEVINPSICSTKTRIVLNDMLVKVVENGTGKSVRSNHFSIAGKTGTAQIAGGGRYGSSGHYVSFCGFFPADKPKYTCFVGIRRPKGIPSAGGMSGQVFKNIAEKTYVKSVHYPIRDYPIDSLRQFAPKVKNGASDRTIRTLKKLDYKTSFVAENSDWIQTQYDNSAYVASAINISEGSTPNVRGMGARDALYILEKSGLKVRVKGSGRVVSQSIPAGSKIVKGKTVIITLE